MAYLHELKEFNDVLKIASQHEGAPIPMVEKDYWIMHCLWGLQRQGIDFYLKGGTSLSKGFNIIHRFSEDIDIMMVPPENMEVKTGKNHTKNSHIKSRLDFFDWIIQEIKIPGIANVKYDPTAERDEKARNADIILDYETVSEEKIDKLKEGILLEVGFDNVDPYTEKDITSWATTYGMKAGLQFDDTQAIRVKCYNPEYTFVEKLQAVSTKFRQHQETGSMARNFLRHYYDLYMLLGQNSVQKFIGTDKYFEHKEKRFRGNDEKDLTKNQAFILSDEKVREFYEEKYENGSSLYYKGKPAFAEILSKLSAILPNG